MTTTTTTTAAVSRKPPRGKANADLPKGPPKPSRWANQLARQQYIRFLEKYREHETKNRIRELTRVKKELQSRFMKLYRYYRHKKFDEPLEMENEQVDNLDDSFERIMRMADEQEKKMDAEKKRLENAFAEPAEISDLDTVNEEDEIEQEIEFSTKQEAAENI